MVSVLLSRYIHLVAEGAKRSPELIQLLELHTQFSTITPYSQVRWIQKFSPTPHPLEQNTELSKGYFS